MKDRICFTDILHGVRMIVIFSVAVILCSLQVSCDHSELWNEIPGEISEFINQYYPNSELVSVAHNGGDYQIRIDDGPGMVFGSDYKWIEVNGYGMPLPQVLLFDQLPPRLYDYLQGTQQLNTVFSMSREKDVYTLGLMSSTLTFNTETGELRGSDAVADGAKS